MARSQAPRSAADNWLALDHQLCFALYSASLAMTKAYKPLLEPLGLTYPQYLVMLVLWELQRLRDAADERRVLLQLTPAGRKLKARAAKVPQTIACATACELRDISQLAAQLKQLRDRLTDSPQRAG